MLLMLLLLVLPDTKALLAKTQPPPNFPPRLEPAKPRKKRETKTSWPNKASKQAAAAVDKEKAECPIQIYLALLRATAQESYGRR